MQPGRSGGTSSQRSAEQYDRMMVDQFPEIEGTSLSLVEHRLPGTLAGEVNLRLLNWKRLF